VGSAGIGSYGYAVIVDGDLVEVENTGGGSPRSAHTIPIQNLANSISDSTVTGMRSAASRSVADGSCHFLTITLRSGEYKQIVVYGPPSRATFAGRTIETLLQVLHRVELHLPEK
jgi:hypothetical protein